MQQVSQSEDKEFAAVIHPWKVFFDQKWNRDFFHNPLTNESVWELPEDVQQRVIKYYELKEQDEQAEEEPNNIVKYLDPKDRVSKEEDPKTIMSRPARKQVEQSLAVTYAYKQGDQEYNIWYDKFLTNDKFRDREVAPTRCNPEVDSGYTKADFMEKFSSYFCYHFAKGCCVEGVNCKWYHRIPTYEECTHIDQVRDVFGRTRHASHRDDMAGVGSFMKECRTLLVSDYKMPNGNDPLKQMYEILFRHFSAWGEVENININPGKGHAFVKYSHRCMAEFAKEAMNNQSLDSGEVISIKWAQEVEDTENDKVAKDFKHKHRFDKKAAKKAKAKEPEKYESGYGEERTDEDKLGEELKMNLSQAEFEQYKKKKKEVDENVSRMAQILSRLEKQDNDEEEEEGEGAEGGAAGGDQGFKGYVPPDKNNLPLFTK